MTGHTNGLIAYKTNPHIDQREAGIAAAEMLVQTLHRRIRPVQTLVQVPLAISISQQHTEAEPCKSLYAYAQQLSKEPDILSISILLGFPYADVPEMGTSIIVVSNGNDQAAVQTGNSLSSYIMNGRERFAGRENDIGTVMGLLSTAAKPVLLLDMGDNVGGGAPGNSSFLLDALERDGRFTAFICIYDPEAVSQAARYGNAGYFDIRLPVSDGHYRSYRVRLLRIADGKFNEETPRHGGQVHFDMGTVAIVQTEKGNTIMLTTLRVSPFSLRQLTTFQIIPAHFDVVIAKGVNAPIAAYAPVCPTVIKVDTPGLTQADMTLFTYRHRRSPLYPFENTQSCI